LTFISLFQTFILSFGRFPQRTDFMCGRFGTLGLFHLRMCRGTGRVFRNVGT